MKVLRHKMIEIKSGKKQQRQQQRKLAKGNGDKTESFSSISSSSTSDDVNVERGLNREVQIDIQQTNWMEKIIKILPRSRQNWS
jgi:hypothetical protein